MTIRKKLEDELHSPTNRKEKKKKDIFVRIYYIIHLVYRIFVN